MNTKTKHTAGPWHMSHDVGDGRSIAKEVAPNCGRLLPLATAHECHAWKGSQISREEMIANSQLIAAAPELLEALQQAANQLRVGYSLKVSDDDVRRMCPAYSQAVDAIAKAKGEM